MPNLARRREEKKAEEVARLRAIERETRESRAASRDLVHKWAGTYLNSGHPLHLACATEAVRKHIEKYGELPRCHGYLWRLDGAGDLCKLPLASRRSLPRHAPLAPLAHRARISGRKMFAE